MEAFCIEKFIFDLRFLTNFNPMRINTEYKMVGLMSGTSGDGLDIVYCELNKNVNWTFKIGPAETIPFPDQLRKDLFSSHDFSGRDLNFLDMGFGKWMGEQVKVFCEKHGLHPDAIASHGHTVFHQPEKGTTLQIGNGWSLFEAAGYPVINDFRTQDVQLGGQGAPLVPIGDQKLFGEYDFCLNLGGISNISMESPDGRIAFDICPFNLLLNPLALRLGLPYDDGGAIAKTGSIIPDFLSQLEKLPYYEHNVAKSLARENVDEDYAPLINFRQEAIEDILATLIDHFSLRISDVVSRNRPSGKDVRILVTGGGAYHSFFMDKLAVRCGGRVNLILPEKAIIDFKEALIFAFLGVLRIRGEANCLCSVTGAKRDSCGGTLYGIV